MTVEIRLQFRFTPTRSFADIDPLRIAPTVDSLQFVTRYKLYDDRLSDADFVTLVVALNDPSSGQLAALRDALTAVTGVHAFAVDRSGTTDPLGALPPELLVEIASTEASAGD